MGLHQGRGSRRRAGLRGDAGQTTVEQVGVLGVVALLIAALAAAFTLNATAISGDVARIVCQVLTLGQGDCGGGGTTAESREPLSPCLLAGRGDNINLGIGFTFVEIGSDRGIRWEQRSDGTYRVQQTQSARGGGTAGVGGQVSLTVMDTEMGAGASAGVSGGVVFEGGQEWIVSSAAERDRLLSAENWSRVDSLVQTAPGGAVLPWIRDAVGLGETFPPPDRVFVAAGGYADGSAYVGANGVATGRADASGSRLMGFSYSPDRPDDKTFYYKTTTEASALAGVVGLGESSGATLSGSVETMTTITVRDGEVVQATRTGIAAGESGGLTNVLFGASPTLGTGSTVGGGVQYDATLDVRTDADRLAVASLVAGAGMDLRGTGITSLDPTGSFDPLSSLFTEAVQQRGDLTRVGVTPGGSTPFAVDASVEAGPVAGLSGGYSTSTMDYANPEYFDGTAFTPRTNC